MPVDAWLLDTNILIRGLSRQHPLYTVIRRAILTLRRQDAKIFVAAQNLIEFWAVATRPVDANGLGMSVQWAAAQVMRARHFFPLVPETADIYSEWERLVTKHEVSGKKVHDARIIAAMNVHGIPHLLTCDVEDFARYPGIQASSSPGRRSRTKAH